MSEFIENREKYIIKLLRKVKKEYLKNSCILKQKSLVQNNVNCWSCVFVSKEDDELTVCDFYFNDELLPGEENYYVSGHYFDYSWANNRYLHVFINSKPEGERILEEL